MLWILLSVLTCGIFNFNENIPEIDEQFLVKINRLRKSGCYCGHEKMQPVPPLTFNLKLKKSAFRYAKQMHKEDFFGHIDPRGRDLTYRIDKVGYKWKAIGENLGHNQETITKIFYDWLQSPTHCKMMMDIQMSETAIAKYGNYWVQHLGTRK